MSNPLKVEAFTPDSCPVVFLAFADDKERPLKMIQQEQEFIFDSLMDFADRNFLKVRKTGYASTEKLFAYINRYSNRMSIFHFGGHAGMDMLQLEKTSGESTTVQAKGIAGLLGTEKNLKLVFLNGCATYGQVDALLAQGVPAVIATKREIKDKVATTFAKAFYDALGSGDALKIAFEKAKARVETIKESPEVLHWKKTRCFDGRNKDPGSDLPWGIYTTKESESILDWKLPQIEFHRFVITPTAFTPQKQINLNSEFVKKVFDAIYNSNGSFAISLIRRLEEEKKKAGPADVRDAIIRSFPAPISIKLRALFALEKETELDHGQYLSHILNLFQKISEFLAYTALSQLWDELNHFGKKNLNFHIGKNELLQIKQLFALDRISQPFFNYLSLFNTILQIFQRNEISCYIVEFGNQNYKLWSHEKTQRILQFFHELQEEVQEGFHDQKKIQTYTEQAILQMADLLTNWSFLVNYKMAVVKYIELRQCKYLPLKFLTNLVELDNNKNVESLKDVTEKHEKAADTETVVLYRDQVIDGINLSPFMIDENALDRKPNSKIYIFSHCQTNGDPCYYLMENPKIFLQVTDNKYPEVKQQFTIAKRLLQGEKAKKTEIKEIIKKNSPSGEHFNF